MSCRCRVAASAYFINASPSVQVPSAPRPYSSLFCSSAHPPTHLLPPLAIHMHHLSPFSSICICCHATTSPAIGDISICDCSISLGASRQSSDIPLFPGTVPVKIEISFRCMFSKQFE